MSSLELGQGLQGLFIRNNNFLDAYGAGITIGSQGDAYGMVGILDHGTAQADHHKLGLLRLAFNHLSQSLGIGSVQHHVDFVEGIEGGGSKALEGKHEGKRRERLLAAGESLDALHLLVSWLCANNETTFERIFRILQ